MFWLCLPGPFISRHSCKPSACHSCMKVSLSISLIKSCHQASWSDEMLSTLQFLEHLACIKSLRYLDVSLCDGASVVGLGHISRLPRLDVLRLQHCHRILQPPVGQLPSPPPLSNPQTFAAINSPREATCLSTSHLATEAFCCCQLQHAAPSALPPHLAAPGRPVSQPATFQQSSTDQSNQIT